MTKKIGKVIDVFIPEEYKEIYNSQMESQSGAVSAPAVSEKEVLA